MAEERMERVETSVLCGTVQVWEVEHLVATMQQLGRDVELRRTADGTIYFLAPISERRKTAMDRLAEKHTPSTPSDSHPIESKDT